MTSSHEAADKNFTAHSYYLENQSTTCSILGAETGLTITRSLQATARDSVIVLKNSKGEEHIAGNRFVRLLTQTDCGIRRYGSCLQESVLLRVWASALPHRKVKQTTDGPGKGCHLPFYSLHLSAIFPAIRAIISLSSTSTIV